MDDLVAWTRAQLDEDVALAPGVHLEACDSVRRHVDRNQVVWQVGPCNCGCPARVLREVEAKRLIIELYEYAVAAWTLDRDKPNPPTVHLGEKTIAEAVLRLLALSYADRPGYREEWRP